MESFANLVRVSLPNYLKGLPIPNSVGGLFHLSFKELISLTPLTLLFGSLAYYSYRKVSTSGARCNSGDDKKAKVNLAIKKDCPKVVDSVDIEDLLNSDKKVVSYCRCWRSAKFPFCDGTHNKWNEETGDNVGPLCIKVKKDT